MERKVRSKKLARVDERLCAACGCCAKVCPRRAISIWKGLFAAVDGDACVGCAKCERACPAGIIEMEVLPT